MMCKIPEGYTEEELERDNTYNQWLYENLEAEEDEKWFNDTET